MSTGLMTFEDVSHSVNFINRSWQDLDHPGKLAVLHCVTSYPTSPENANLSAITKLQDLGVTVGYSDHTLGIDAGVLSVALGARIIEKHFTLDKNQSDFRDHQLSADPKDLSNLVQKVKEAQTLLGKQEKTISADEQGIKDLVRRSIVAKHDLKQGVELSFNDISWVRPGKGIAPGQESLIMGKCLKHDLPAGAFIQLSDFT